MTQTVAVPLWLLLLILLFAGVTFASHFLFPSVRWFLRRRLERAVSRLNARLKRPIEPFKLARRHDTIQRLIYDPTVARAVAEEARREAIPEAVAFERAGDYAREIVPAFSATAYFGIGIRLARWLSRSLYRMRLSDSDLAAIEALDPEAAVVFVMNHRSNMDYVLVTWLVSGNSALAYAVGEWARVWPLSALVRAMGAYFIRRRDRSPLYRRVLARYVQMAVAGRLTQAMFPEGRLSLDGRMGEPRLGLLSYLVEGAAEAGRDVVFVPVALNYDRVLEDRFLVEAGRTGVRRFRPPLGTVVRGVGGHVRDRLLGRFRGFGTAKVALGEPVSLRAFLARGPAQPTAELAAELMARVAAAMPVVPVPLVARRLLSGPATPGALAEAVARDLAALGARGVALPARGPEATAADGAALLRERALVIEEGGLLRVRPGAEPLLAYYAASVAHLFGEPEAPPVPAPRPRAVPASA